MSSCFEKIFFGSLFRSSQILRLTKKLFIMWKILRPSCHFPVIPTLRMERVLLQTVFAVLMLRNWAFIPQRMKARPGRKCYACSAAGWRFLQSRRGRIQRLQVPGGGLDLHNFPAQRRGACSRPRAGIRPLEPVYDAGGAHESPRARRGQSFMFRHADHAKDVPALWSTGGLPDPVDRVVDGQLVKAAANCPCDERVIGDGRCAHR